MLKIHRTDASSFEAYQTKSLNTMVHHDYVVGDVLDVLDIFRKEDSKEGKETWRGCQVVQTEGPYLIKIAYIGWNRSFDEWLHVLQDAKRIAPFGSHTQEETETHAEVVNETFVKCLQKDRALTVVPMDSDGNCLFRAVAHQVYGDVERHDIVRSDCCDYLEKNRPRFEPLLESGGFEAYVENKRKPQVWGDDPEIRAMEELYDRPMMIFVASGDGTQTEPLKLHFEGDLPSDEEMGDYTPICLSFHGNNHYNSVIPHFVNDGEDLSEATYSPPPLRTGQVIRKHRVIRRKSSRGFRRSVMLEASPINDDTSATMQ
mmetsp:Transcript_1964/g.3471  ORF Transcript_1964/g.3471 Transcript_1964/m.3471 type:complete len:316 (-) Transcript_1964:656-1603(-)